MSQRNAVSHACPDCSPLSRRDFLRNTTAGIATTAAAAGLYSLGGSPCLAAVAGSAASPAPSAESLVAQFYKTLSDDQKKSICFAFDHPLRKKVDNNWFIVDKHIKDLLNKDQRQMVRDIFTGLHSEEYADRVMHQVETDNGEDGGFNSCAVAMFGQPGEKFEFVFTGRHVTRRCDGNSVEGEGFGGPIFYGHAAEGFHESAQHKGNIYWYQALQANQVFQALDGKQRELALRADARPERHTATVDLSEPKRALTGIPLSELSADQKGLVRKVMADLLAPFRKADADKALAMIEAGGFDAMHMTFYNGKGMDIGNDGVWDVWQLESPNMVWYFRGAPHVHTWVHVREPARA
ncbi:MAG TPA: DUF3500 domain-containing protein [Tepidisphaeraceae bacterium]|jgi:hypothetical protein|nr:DUF3500 domain-containing protein [Tepidisphaeraceae bacterium]